MLADRSSQAAQHHGPLLRARARPRALVEGAARRGHCRIDVLDETFGDVDDGQVRGRVQGLEGAAVQTWAELAIDVMELRADLDLLREGGDMWGSRHDATVARSSSPVSSRSSVIRSCVLADGDASGGRTFAHSNTPSCSIAHFTGPGFVSRNASSTSGCSS